MEVVNIVFDKKLLYTKDQAPESDDSGYQFNSFVDCHYAVNFDLEHAIIDYHLPLAFLVKKYYPDTVVNEIPIDQLQNGSKFIYPVTFKYLYRFFEKHTLDELLSKIDPVIAEGCIKHRGILLLNDSHEYASYVNFKGMDFTNVLKSFKKVSKDILKNIIIASANPDNENFAGNNHKEHKFTFLQNSKNRVLKIAYHFTGNKNVRIYGFRFFEEVVAAQVTKFYPAYNFHTKLSSLTKLDFKHFICLNNINKNFRTVMVYKIINSGLSSYFYLSHKKIENASNAGYTKWKQLLEPASFDRFLLSLPLSSDRPSSDNPWNLVPWELVNNTFCWLVTETLYEGDIFSRCFFTEKTYKPISMFMPFILVGEPFALYNLRREGYRTFGDWWDESYDEETDPILRMEKIVALITSICNLGREKILQMYREMQETLEHNYKRLLNTTAAKPYIDALMNTYKNDCK